MTRNVDVAIVGAGSAGLAAMTQVRKVSEDFVLIDSGPLGTTCARVGCMPSKAAIQVADDMYRRRIFKREGILGGDALKLDMEEAFEHVRNMRDILVDRVLAHNTDELDDRLVGGFARFLAPGVLDVDGERIEAKSIILAVGSSPFVPEPWRELGESIITTDDLFDTMHWPKTLGVIGLGVIGLELGQALARMGIKVTGFDRLDAVGGLDDDLLAITAKDLVEGDMTVHLGHEVKLLPLDGRVRIDAGEQRMIVHKALVAVGRRSNLHAMELDKAGIPLREDGLPDYNPYTTRAGDARVFVAGDGIGSRQILHEAVAEGRIAGYNAMREASTAFARTVPMSVCYSDPHICHVGARYPELDPETVVVGNTRFGPVGRALIMGRNRGMLRLYVRKVDGRVLGAAMVAPDGEYITHLLAWAIEQNLTVFDLARMPFYHPTVVEGLQGAIREAIAQLPELAERFDHPAELRPLEDMLPS